MADTYKCPSCASPLVFDVREQKMKCASCGNSFEVEDMRQLNEIEQAVQYDPKYNWADPEGGQWSEEEMSHLRACKCPSCGSEMIVPDDQATAKCVYCDNPLVMGDVLTGMSRPDAVIPFAKSKEDAVAQFKAFLKGKLLLPSAFERANRIEEINGVYVPFWLFRCGTDSDVTYKAEKVRSYRQGNYMITETRHYTVRRGGNMDFSDVPVDASDRMDDVIMEAVEPFNASQKKDFALPYLSGFRAQKADVDAENCKKRADERIRQSVIDAFRSTVNGYTSVTQQKSSVRIQHGGVQEVMMPVWMLNTRYKDKVYTFAMNGQTGRFIGNLPVSFAKAAAWFLGVAAGLTGIAALVMYLMTR